MDAHARKRVAAVTNLDELYVTSRRVLLDALEALRPHVNSIVLVGAQAIYLRCGEGELAVAPFTTDGDLALDPRILSETPPLERALSVAGFLPKGNDSVGIWVTSRKTSQLDSVQVAIDLLVPISTNQEGRRAAHLVGHHSRAARLVRGLEGALVDADEMVLPSLDDTHPRSATLRVAGPAALLVAKVHKLSERLGTHRQSAKDALDVLRLLQGTDTQELASRYVKLLEHAYTEQVARQGLQLFGEQFGARRGHGIQLAIQAAGPLADEQQVAASCEALAADLLQNVSRV